MATRRGRELLQSMFSYQTKRQVVRLTPDDVLGLNMGQKETHGPVNSDLPTRNFIKKEV